MNSEEIIIELALFLNKELLNDNKINYQIFKLTEDNLLKQLKNI